MKVWKKKTLNEREQKRDASKKIGARTFVKDDKQKMRKKSEERVAFPCPVSTRVAKSYHRKVSVKTIFTYFRSPHRVLSPWLLESPLSSLPSSSPFIAGLCEAIRTPANMSSLLAGKIGKWWREFWYFPETAFRFH